MKIDVGYDSSIFIAKSIENVFHTIIEAIVLVVLVIFVFLRSFRATLVPIVTIPVSLDRRVHLHVGCSASRSTR